MIFSFHLSCPWLLGSEAVTLDLSLARLVACRNHSPAVGSSSSGSVCLSILNLDLRETVINNTFD